MGNPETNPETKAENTQNRQSQEILHDASRHISIRLAQAGDENFIVEMVRQLAQHEHSLQEVNATAKQLHDTLFVGGEAECLIGMLNGVDCGIALFFRNFSSWEATSGLFLEDLFVKEQARGHGLGRALLKALAQLAKERGYARIEWACLDWNEPSLRFYKGIGAQVRKEWILHRLDKSGIDQLLA
ncbi:MAG: GNAT family N-acetyltransferase [Coriobacteriales bacterium]|jgi:GNAT superfamily N-acetyltransferase|nr:GNAT family N-acetyltransferase [Coriobacteriales bacterium]